LFKLHRQPLPERAVEHRIAGGVREVGEDNRVLLGQGVRAMRVELPAADGDADDHHGGTH
jgi:hypothetical protein